MNRYKSRWRNRIEAPLNDSLAVVGDAVVMPSFGVGRSNQYASFSLSDGSERWRVPLEGFLINSALSGIKVVADPDGTAVYIAQDDLVARFAVTNGEKLWSGQVPKEPPFESFMFRPRVVGDRVLLVSTHSRAVALDRRDGKLLWQASPYDNTHAEQLFVRGDLVITLSNEEHDVRAHDLATGIERWRHTLSGPFQITTRLADSLAHAEPVAGLFHVIDANRALLALELASGAVKWQEAISGLASFAIANGALVLTDQASVRVIDPFKGTIRSRHATGGLSLVAPLDAGSGLLQLERATCTIDYASGVIVEQLRNSIAEQDQILDVGAGSVAMTFHGAPRLVYREREKLLDAPLCDRWPRLGEPATHGAVQTIVAGDRVVVFNTAKELEIFQR